ncbi:hypothetical protein Bbelb_072380 [Branchiostoma belcheri]|nr:hypothetical protein Bbelb_072380 [Branchiostoma belcheri]
MFPPGARSSVRPGTPSPGPLRCVPGQRRPPTLRPESPGTLRCFPRRCLTFGLVTFPKVVGEARTPSPGPLRCVPGLRRPPTRGLNRRAPSDVSPRRMGRRDGRRHLDLNRRHPPMFPPGAWVVGEARTPSSGPLRCVPGQRRPPTLRPESPGTLRCFPPALGRRRPPTLRPESPAPSDVSPGAWVVGEARTPSSGPLRCVPGQRRPPTLRPESPGTLRCFPPALGRRDGRRHLDLNRRHPPMFPPGAWVVGETRYSKSGTSPMEGRSTGSAAGTGKGDPVRRGLLLPIPED